MREEERYEQFERKREPLAEAPNSSSESENPLQRYEQSERVSLEEVAKPTEAPNRARTPNKILAAVGGW